jgi:hypothetical protein
MFTASCILAIVASNCGFLWIVFSDSYEDDWFGVDRIIGVLACMMLISCLTMIVLMMIDPRFVEWVK